MNPPFGLKADPVSNALIRIIREVLVRRYGIESGRPIPLKSRPSEHLEGLELLEQGEGGSVSSGLIVGSVRMGYGHHRMGYSVCSWAIANNVTPYLHDLLALESPESNLVRETDDLYSFFSRLASEWGGPVEWLWGVITTNGDVNSLEFSLRLAEVLTNTMAALDSSLPVVSSYPMNGQIAAACGFKRVVNLVPDYYPQYYLLVPGALNLVQGPDAYDQFVKMGLPKDNLAVAGHWVSRDIAVNAASDSEKRIARLNQRKPLRILFSVGGAGAQKGFLLSWLEKSNELLGSGGVQFLINTGDHKAVFEALTRRLGQLNIDFSAVTNYSEVNALCRSHPLDGAELKHSVTVFHFEAHADAFVATDHLIRICDVLATKPSELAFYPVPKLFVKRVGDHEAASALRSARLNEGTEELREPSLVHSMVERMCREPEVLLEMNEAVIRHAATGIYNGSKAAVEMALAMK
jgi:hypothetical protein